ncbi:MAG: NAD(P)/FAD-dependent oxidoreductase [Eubacteriales bacterium]|nr:NAD(P)/FAD-dependent oxidoreductase [Eubacteriales bacterium]
MSETPSLQVAIIGGGAAGLMAAIAARRAGAEVTILEKNQRVGRKLLATGNGRCNLTNTDLEISRFHGQNPKFVHSALARFDQYQTITFFEQLGVAHKVEAGGKVFPVSNQASSGLDVMRYELDEIGVATVLEFEVDAIAHQGKGFTIRAADGREHQADRVIVATGGKAAPQLGSNGSGYRLAEQFGHRVIEPFPALVQLRLNHTVFKHLRGIKFEGAVEVLVNKQTIDRATGEILFTDYGVSGPPIFDVSRTAGALLQKRKPVWLKLVLVADVSREALDQLLLKRFSDRPRKTLAFSFVGFLSKRLAPVVLKEAGIEDPERPVSSLTAQERQRIVDVLQDWRFEVVGTNSWTAAQVTAGGVEVRDLDPRTLESRLVPGLYFAGEVVDVDGDCGGFNLQWAWSSGWVAGRSAADVG